MAATRPGKRIASAAARLLATAVLPEPPLGDTTAMHLPIVLGGGRVRDPLVALHRDGQARQALSHVVLESRRGVDDAVGHHFTTE